MGTSILMPVRFSVKLTRERGTESSMKRVSLKSYTMLQLPPAQNVGAVVSPIRKGLLHAEVTSYHKDPMAVIHHFFQQKKNISTYLISNRQNLKDKQTFELMKTNATQR